MSNRKKVVVCLTQCAYPECAVVCDSSEYCEACHRYICHDHRIVDDVFEDDHDVDAHWIDYGVVEFE